MIKWKNLTLFLPYPQLQNWYHFGVENDIPLIGESQCWRKVFGNLSLWSRISYMLKTFILICTYKFKFESLNPFRHKRFRLWWRALNLNHSFEKWKKSKTNVRNIRNIRNTGMANPLFLCYEWLISCCEISGGKLKRSSERPVTSVISAGNWWILSFMSRIDN